MVSAGVAAGPGAALRGKRRLLVAAGAVVLAVGLGLGLLLGTAGGTARASCHQRTTTVRQGESLVATRLPKGMVVTAGSVSKPRATPIIYSVSSLKDGPYARFTVHLGTTLARLVPSDFTTQPAEVGGRPAVLAQPPKVLSDAQIPEAGKGELYWQSAPGTVIAMETYELAPSAMLYVADSVVYKPGRLVMSSTGC